MRDALLLLRGAGYAPRVVVDAGANVGEWTRLARSVFSEAAFHLIEPQPACLAALEQLARERAGLVVHPVAVTEPGVMRVRLIGGGDGGGATGAWVARLDERAPDEIECPATTLDALLADRLAREDRALLKLDLEGHELTALCGSARMLPLVEVVLTELQLFEINDNQRPVFGDVMSALGERGFELYDIACLSPRPRDRRFTAQIRPDGIFGSHRQIRFLISDGKNPLMPIFSGPRKKSVRETPRRS